MNGGIEEKTQQIIRNLKAVAEAANLDLSHVVKTTLFLINMADYPSINDVYGQYFKDGLPARTVVQAAGLPKNPVIEMEAIVYLGNDPSERLDEPS